MKNLRIKNFISFAAAAAAIFGLFTGVNFCVSAETTYTEPFIARVAPIDDKSEWIPISDRGGLEAMKDGRDGKYYLTNDIDLSDAAWTPVGTTNYNPFTGVFDGQGYVIKNMKITGSFEHSGLFGYAANATIKNVGLEGINVNATSSTVIYAGGICGYGNNVEILNSYTAGIISANGFYSHTGGLTGGFSGIIENCYSSVDISGDFEVTSYTSSAGGLAGIAKGIVKNCYAAGNVSILGDLGGSIGGLIGECGEAYEILSCYRLSSQVITGGGIINQSGTPLDDNTMKQKSSFAGFDFDSVWVISESKSYPYLRAFVSNISISSASGIPGQEIYADVKIENNSGIAGYKLIVSYDASKIEYIGGTNTIAVGAGGLLELQSVNHDTASGRVIIVAVNDTDVTEDGLLFTLKFWVKTGIPSDNYPLTLFYEENKDIQKQDYTPVNPYLTNGNINIVTIIRGDANGDGNVNVGDLICLARHFSQIEVITDGICIEAADTNIDGDLTVADLIRLARHIAEIELLPAE